MVPALLLGFAQSPPDRAALVTGVGPLSAPGALPGAMVASKGAFVVLGTANAPLAVAGRVGAGRAVAVGHESYFGAGPLRDPNNARFLANALAWLGGRPVGRLKVGTLDLPGAVEAIRKGGAEALVLQRGEVEAGLVGIDVLMMTQGSLDGDAKTQQAVVAWTKAGHGLLVAGPAWGWQQLNPGKSLRTDHSGNRMLLPFGMGFTGESHDGSPAPVDDPLLQTDSALAALRKGGLSPAETARATGAVGRALGLEKADDGLAREIDRLAAAENLKPGQPLTASAPFSRLKATLQARAWEETAPEMVKAHPSAADFPGAVDPRAKPLARRVAIDTKVPQWHPTGLYAAPGKVVTITLPANATGGSIGVRIGPHTDELWHLDKWNRFPAVSRHWPLKQTVTKIASPFGGTVLIDVVGGSGLGTVPVEIEGAVPTPYFKRGVTTKEEWARQLAEPGGPWVELEGHKVALSLPRRAVADLKDPEALMAFWDETFDLARQFYAAPPRDRPERYAVDRQISAGYMHSGYPIMTFEDVEKTFADLAKLRGKGATWGFFHELGHNFQEGDWTFDGTGEVTNNLFSLYASEKLNGITPAEYGLAHPAMAPAEQEKRLTAYLAKGAKFEDWKRAPFLALTMYTQIREAFGWEPFTKAFATYRTGPRPRGEMEQHDFWMTRMSRATGRNLGPFFVAWGVPTSEGARDSVKALPAWMPEGWPKR